MIERPELSIFVPSLRIGGAERAMLSLVIGYAARGVGVELVLAEAAGSLLELVPQNVKVVDLGHRSVLNAFPALVRYLRKSAPATMLSAMDNANIAALLARRVARVPTRVIVTVHTQLTLNYRRTGKLGDVLVPLLVRLTYRQADAIIAVSEGVADDLSAATTLPRSVIRVIHNPVLLDEIVRLSWISPGHPWFHSEESPVILAVGRLNRAKDFATLIRAFAIVRKSREARLLILGDGEERATLGALVSKLGLGPHVDLHRASLNPYSYMARSSILVLSSAWEGFANVLVESLALGVPVVATDCPGGPDEILNHGEFGTLVKVGDPVALAQAIAAALDTPHDSSRLRARAADFSIEAILPRYSEVVFG